MIKSTAHMCRDVGAPSQQWPHSALLPVTLLLLVPVMPSTLSTREHRAGGWAALTHSDVCGSRTTAGFSWKLRVRALLLSVRLFEQGTLADCCWRCSPQLHRCLVKTVFLQFRLRCYKRQVVQQLVQYVLVMFCFFLNCLLSNWTLPYSTRLPYFLA